MPFVHSLTATPPVRYDVATPWNRVRIEQSPDNTAWAAIDTQPLAPLDADPAHPALRHLTTNDATIATGYFRVVWLDADDNESAPSLSTFSPSAADDGYPSLDVLLAESSEDALLGLTTEQQVAKRRDAIDSIEAHTRQTFTAEGSEAAPVTKLIDGTGSDRLYLPKRLALLTGARIDGALVNTGLDLEVHPAESKAYVKLVSPLDAGSWVTRVRRTPGDPGPAFRAAQDNVEISGVWGWTLDDWEAGRLGAIQTAIRFDMEDQAFAESNKLASTVRSARALGVGNISQGGLAVAIKQGEPGLSSRVRRKLIPFVWQVPIGAVV